jgi:serine/threonine-protein kinase HipA
MSAGRALDVYANTRQVGVLREANDLWTFDYLPSWAAQPDAFDLSPALPRSRLSHIDGATERPVQWYFDNLLPEEGLRTALAKDAGLEAEDAFALLQYFGAESAGSLILLPEHAPLAQAPGLKELPADALAARIQNLPRVPLNHDAPKRMSIAGAQHKLLVVLRKGRLYEPLPGDVSTHILKPDHPEVMYASSVINEYFTMRLASVLGLPVPRVARLYVPQPVYVVERFDRRIRTGEATRLHAIDSCQLLNKARLFKYQAATLKTLAQAVLACRTRPKARLQLFKWLVFNLLVGNHDNHLKNISFLVSHDGVEIAPCYDLLSTAVWETKAFADEKEIWPRIELAISLPGAAQFADITRDSVLAAAGELGLGRATAVRELDRMVGAIEGKAEALMAEIDAENAVAPEEAHAYFGGEVRLLRAIRHIIIAQMVAKLQPA